MWKRPAPVADYFQDASGYVRERCLLKLAVKTGAFAESELELAPSQDLSNVNL